MSSENHIADDRKKVRLIDANALPVTTLTDGEYWTKDVVYKRDIDEAPTVDAVEVVHGEWTTIEDDYTGMTALECSECNEEWWFEDDPPIKYYHYCPNCGAKMDGGAEHAC